ncbi:MAG: transglutaminase domain-containing protein [Lachnospiraceae bacterium]|nr:transglutaminase domain-containing protein [Lachnospiraceae bacterium]MDD3659106.1 transglutaminase domain-containing protein [Lachnospiraceae bacterium]
MKKRISILLFQGLICTLLLNGCNTYVEEKNEQVTPEFHEEETAQTPESEQDTTEFNITEYDIEDDAEGIPDEDVEKRNQIGLNEEGISRIISGQTGLYSFGRLNEKEKFLYAELVTILEQRAHGIVVSSVLEEEIDKVFQCVMNDHPEIFYVSGYTYTKYTLDAEVQRIAFSGSYTMDEDQVLEAKKQIDAYTSQCFLGISPDAGEYEKVKYIYEYLIDHTEYDLSALENQNMVSVCMYQKSVCQGYAKTMQYLLNKAGIRATLVIGQVNTGEGHAWNLVWVDGEPYYVDATWGDAFYRFEPSNYDASEQELPLINYDYLCVTTDAISRTHIVDHVVELPICNSIAANYYVREGTYLTYYDDQIVSLLFQKAYQEGKNYLTFKASSQEVYTAVTQNLIDEQKIFEFLSNETKTVAYTTNEEYLTISFWL